MIQNCQSNPEGEKQNKTKQNKKKQHSPRLQTILQSYSNLDCVVLVKNRYTDQWNRLENPEINPDTYGQLFSNKVGKNIKMGKRQSLQPVVLGKPDRCK